MSMLIEKLEAEVEEECCICYDAIGAQNNCTTPCGHKFCFVCMMKSLNANNTCPCCRAVLQEKEEDLDDESEYDEEDGSDEEEGDYHEQNSMASSEKIAKRMEAMGYTMADILTMYLGRLNPSTERTTENFIQKLSDDFAEIVAEEDEATEREHYEKFEMMEEDTRRHNRPAPFGVVEGHDYAITLATLFSQ